MLILDDGYKDLATRRDVGLQSGEYFGGVLQHWNTAFKRCFLFRRIRSIGKCCLNLGCRKLAPEQFNRAEEVLPIPATASGLRCPQPRRVFLDAWSM